MQMNGHFGGFIMSGTSPQQQTHHTHTHVFSEEDRIGTGGTCDVFCGLEKVMLLTVKIDTHCGT